METTLEASLHKLKQTTEKARSIALLSHVIPDADAYSSVLAWQKYLESTTDLDTNIHIFVDNGGQVADLYQPLFENSLAILNPENPLPAYDLAIALDCAQLGRLGIYADIFSSAGYKVNIDHHETNTHFGDLNMVFPASSTCECLYHMLKHYGIKTDNGLATYIYVGIITDTLNLTGNVSSATLRIAADLQKKVNADILRDHFFKNSTKAKIELFSLALKNIEYLYGERFALLTITQNDLQKTGAQFEDTLGIIDHAAGVQGVDLAAILIEKNKNNYNVSLRSRGDVNVLDIAGKFHGGGNNANMGAFQYEGELQNLRRELNSCARKQLKIAPANEDPPSLFK